MDEPASANRPVIGITCDTHQRAPGDTEHGRYRYECSPHYAAAVTEAGGIPLLLPFEPDRLGDYLALCDGFVLTGGDDPDTTPFGEPVHPKIKPMRPERQRFELALLRALDEAAHPVLGVCLGMQLMALHHGGRLHQHLPDAPDLSPQQVAAHKHAPHPIRRTVDVHPLLPPSGTVYSHHDQAVADPGRMRILALSDEATAGRVIEAVDRPDTDAAGKGAGEAGGAVAGDVAGSVAGEAGGRFYLGVQWHPERTEDAGLGQRLFDQLVRACVG